MMKAITELYILMLVYPTLTLIRVQIGLFLPGSVYCDWIR